MNGAAVIAEILRREGTSFSAAHPRNPLIEACAELDIRTILCRQERVGVGIAEAIRVSVAAGRRRVCSAGGAGHRERLSRHRPGLCENVPMLIIPAGLPLARQYVRPVFRASDVYRPVTKWSALAHSVQELPDLMRRAYHAMRSGKGGPVLVESRPRFGSAISRRAQLHPGADAAHGARSGCCKRGRPHPAGGEDRCCWQGKACSQRRRASTLLRWPSSSRRRLPPRIRARRDCREPSAGARASTRSRPKMFTDFMARADVVLAIGSSLTRTPFGPSVPPGETIIHSTNEAADISRYRVHMRLLAMPPWCSTR